MSARLSQSERASADAREHRRQVVHKIRVLSSAKFVDSDSLVVKRTARGDAVALASVSPSIKETGHGQEGKEEGQEEGRQEKEEGSITSLGRSRRDVTPGPSSRGSLAVMRPTIEISTTRGRKRPRGRFC